MERLYYTLKPPFTKLNHFKPMFPLGTLPDIYAYLYVVLVYNHLGGQWTTRSYFQIYNLADTDVATASSRRCNWVGTSCEEIRCRDKIVKKMLLQRRFNDVVTTTLILV